MSAAAFGAIARQAADRPELEDVFRALKQMQRDMDWLACVVIRRNKCNPSKVEQQGAK